MDKPASVSAITVQPGQTTLVGENWKSEETRDEDVSNQGNFNNINIAFTAYIITYYYVLYYYVRPHSQIARKVVAIVTSVFATILCWPTGILALFLSSEQHFMRCYTLALTRNVLFQFRAWSCARRGALARTRSWVCV